MDKAGGEFIQGIFGQLLVDLNLILAINQFMMLLIAVAIKEFRRQPLAVTVLNDTDPIGAARLPDRRSSVEYCKLNKRSSKSNPARQTVTGVIAHC